jgi:hypothetical protein
MELALGGRDRQVVDAGMAREHESVLVELPVLVTIGAEPVPGVVVPLVGETHGDAIAGECPELLRKAVVELAVPFAGQESDDLIAAGQKLGAVSPAAIDGVCQRNLVRIAGVPGVFGLANLFGGSGLGKWRKRRALFLIHSFDLRARAADQ